MRINAIIELRFPDRARVTIHKEVYSSREQILEIVRTGLSGDQDYANIAGSMVEHLEGLASLSNFTWESDVVVDIRFAVRLIGIKYRIQRTRPWRFTYLTLEEFIAIDPGRLMRTIQYESTTWNAHEAQLILGGE